jgi:hypothetical protein
MKRKLLMAITVGTLAASALPAMALEDIRGPLSPSGGQSERTGGASIASSNDEADAFVVAAVPERFLFVPPVFAADATSPDDNMSGSLSPSGSDS